jgi:O-antigen/teichoic acid export membrane protein
VATQKYVSENYGRRDLGAAASVSRLSFTIVALFTLPTLTAVLLLSRSFSTLVLGGDRYAVPFILVLSTSAILNFTALYGADMLGLGMYLEVAIQNLAFILISKASGLALAYTGYGLLGLASGWLIGALSCLILSIYLMRKKLPKPSKQSRDLYGTVFKYSYPVWILAIIGLAQGWADITILYALTGQPAVTGIYYLASAGATLLAIFWIAISMVILPLMSSEEARVGKQALPSIYNASSRLLNILILPIGASLAAISPTAIRIAYGPAYIEGIAPFALLTATAILPAYISINTSTLQAIAETKVLAKIGATSAIIDIALVTILVKPLGANGAALARTAMFLTVFLLTQKTLRSKAQIKIDLSHLAKTTGLSVVVALPLAAIDYTLTYLYAINPVTRLILEGILFLVVYTISLRLFQIVERGELELLKKALPHQLEKILNMLGNFIVHRTIQ